MVRIHLWQLALGVALLAASGASACLGADGQEQLDKAMEAKLAANSMADLAQVIKLCEEAISAGLDEPNRKFANELLAGTLSQRADLICTELFERSTPANRRQGLIQRALADLEQTLAIDAEQPESQFNLGRLYAVLGDNEKALKALNEAVRLTKDEPAMQAKILMLRAGVQTDEARQTADLNDAIKLVPRDADALRTRARFHLSQGKTASAIEDLKAAVVLEPESASTHELLGLALSMAEQTDEALASFNKAIELAPNSPSTFQFRARIKALKQDNAGAIADIEQALKLQPGSISARELHAQLLAGAGRLDDALAEMAILLRAMPDNPEVLIQVGVLCQSAKQHKQALAAFDKALELDPRNASGLRGRADVYLSLSRQGDAVRDYEAALRVDPKNSGVLNNLAWVLATAPEASLRDGKRAIDLATQACEATEYREAHILSTLAAGYAETGDFETAIRWSKKAVELGPKPIKAQLAKELESYQAGQPWREAAPPDDPATDDAPAEDNKSAKSES